MIFTEEFLAGLKKRDWLGFFACLVVSGCAVVLWYHVTHRIELEHPIVMWGWRHYVGVYVIPALALATLMWLALRRYLK